MTIRYAQSPESFPEENIADCLAVFFATPKAANEHICATWDRLFGEYPLIYTSQYIPVEQDPLLTICSVRDFRDCAVLYWRDWVRPDSGEKMSENDVRLVAGQFRDYAASLYRMFVDTNYLAIVFRHEEIWYNPRNIIAPLLPIYARGGGRPPSGIEETVLRDCPVNPDHRPGIWRQFVNPREAQLLCKTLRKPLMQWGYSCE